jgi:hypothetical protein
MASDAGITSAIMMFGLLWFIVKIQDSFRGKDEQYLEWIRHMLTVIGFAVAAVAARLMYEVYEYETPLHVDFTATLNDFSILWMVLLIIITFFYFVMLIRYIFRFFIDMYKKRNGETE